VYRSGFGALPVGIACARRSSTFALSVLRIQIAAAKVPSILGDGASLNSRPFRMVPQTSATTAVPFLSAVKPNPADQCATLWQATP
jgi:hypothetical protein